MRAQARGTHLDGPPGRKGGLKGGGGVGCVPFESCSTS